MRIAVLSDIHANAYALDAVLAHARRQRTDTFWFLGDAVGYGPHPIEAIEFWQTLPPAFWVPGNHDASMTGALTTEGFNDHARHALDSNKIVLDQQRPDLYQWMLANFPDPSRWVRRHLMGQDQYVMVHGALRLEPREHLMIYVKPWLRDLVIEELALLSDQNGKHTGRSCLLSGHTHIPNFCYLNGARNGETELVLPGIDWERPMTIPPGPTLINPGSVGQPRDKDPRASYAVLDTDAAQITFHRVEYPVEQTQRDMRRLGFHQFQRERLKRAYPPDDWPEGWKV